jgi:hypothetical protein
MSKTSILPAVLDDLPVLAQLMTDSYLPQAYMHVFFPLYPSPTHILPFYVANIRSKFEEPNTQVIKLVEQSSGGIVAFVCLTKESGDEKKKSEKSREWLNGLELNWDFVGNVVGGLEGLGECVKGRDHYGLSYSYPSPAGFIALITVQISAFLPCIPFTKGAAMVKSL